MLHLATTILTLSAACETTNAPVLTWPSRVDPSGVFAYRVVVVMENTSTPPPSDTGFSFATNEPFPGLYVYDNTTLPLAAGGNYSYTIFESQIEAAPGKPPVPSPAPVWVAAQGSFCVSPTLPILRDEARAAFGGNFSVLYSNSLASITGRVQPSGFVPTSVSGGYGGATNMFVRDTCAMLFALLEACADPGCGGIVARVLNFTLSSIAAANLSYAPHVMTADENLTHIVSFDLADQTDGTFHLAAVFVAYWRATGDNATAARFFPLLARLVNHYVGAGAVLTPGPGPAYFNATLGLLFNPNLEHSRCGVYWSTFDSLTNSFAAEALRGMAAIAIALGAAPQAATWLSVRESILDGLQRSLGYASSNETRGAPIYSELRGEPHSWWPGPNNEYPPGAREFAWPPANLWGMSFVNTGVAGAFAAVLGRAGDAPIAAGFDAPRFGNTMDTYRRLGSFLWLTDDPAFSALLYTTHVNASLHADGDRAVIVKGLGWELAWAAWTGDDARLLTLARWLGFAASGNLTLPAESYGYDCMRLHQHDCYGDPGNGEQAGWFVWGATLAMRRLGLR